MKFEITAKETAKAAEMLKMFGIPDMDIETVTEAFESRYENWSDWKFSWGHVVVNAIGLSVEVYEASTVKILDAYEDFAPIINKIVGVFSALKPLFTELTDTAGKVVNKIGDVFKTPTRIEVFEYDGIIIVARHNNGSFTIPCFSGKMTDIEAEKAVKNSSPTLKESTFSKRSDFGVGLYRVLLEELIQHSHENGTLYDVDLDGMIKGLEERFGVKYERNN